MIFLQSYKGHKIYLVTLNKYHISYMHSNKIWKRNIRNIKQCKILINKAHYFNSLLKEKNKWIKQITKNGKEL